MSQFWFPTRWLLVCFSGDIFPSWMAVVLKYAHGVRCTVLLSLYKVEWRFALYLARHQWDATICANRNTLPTSCVWCGCPHFTDRFTYCIGFICEYFTVIDYTSHILSIAVVQHRMKAEYGVETILEPLPGYNTARWAEGGWDVIDVATVRFVGGFALLYRGKCICSTFMESAFGAFAVRYKMLVSCNPHLLAALVFVPFSKKGNYSEYISPRTSLGVLSSCFATNGSWPLFKANCLTYTWCRGHVHRISHNVL